MAPKTILLRGDPIYSEATCAATILPGALLTLAGAVRTASADRTCALAGAGVIANTFARENEIIGGDIEDAYASGDNVLAITCKPGDQVLALLAAGQDVAVGARLSAGANGTLVAATAFAQSGTTPFAVTPSTPVIAFALEAVDNDPGTGGAPVFIKVEIV